MGIYDRKKISDGDAVNPSQDYLRGEMYYAVQLNGQIHLLNAQRQAIPLWFCKKQGIQLTTLSTTRAQLSTAGLKQYMSGSFDADPFRIYQEIRKYLTTYIFLRDDRAYSLLALWVMGTYVFRIFRYYPYIHLNAEKGSGKTTLMEMLAPICFNGELSSDFTGAAVCEEIDANSSTLFLDEVEHLGAGRANLLVRILKAGFSKTGRVCRKGKSYSIYSPKMFAGIGETDDVLADRMIRIRMVKRLPTEKSERYFQTNELRAWQSQMVDSLYVFGLQCSGAIAVIYEKDLLLDDQPHLENRSWDIWAPILSIARLVEKSAPGPGSNIFSEIVAMSRDNVTEKSVADQTDNETSRIVLILNAMVDDVKPTKLSGDTMYFHADTVFSYFCAQGFFRGEETRTTLSRLLAQKFGIRCEPQKYNGELARMYRISISELQDYAARYLTAVIGDHAND